MYGFTVSHSRGFSNLDTLKLLYNCYVRSKLEYASLVCTPHYDVHVNQLESVQRKFLKLMYLREEGIYPAVGFPQVELLSRYSLLTYTKSHREFLSQVFLLKILNNSSIAPQILSKLPFNVPRITSNHIIMFFT